jgi:cytochrome c553
VAVAPDADAVAHSRGRTLYNKCIFCHGKDADGDKKQNAPSLRVQEDWYIVRQLQKFKAGVRGVDPKDIGGVQMRPRAMELSEEDMHLVADYIVSSNKGRLRMPPKTVDGDVAHGKSLYSVCVACHGEDGRGNELLNAPPLVGQHDWYLVQQLMNFREGFRGADPNDTTGVVMKPMAMTLADDQAVADVAAYITTLSARSPAASPPASAGTTPAAEWDPSRR